MARIAWTCVFACVLGAADASASTLTTSGFEFSGPFLSEENVEGVVLGATSGDMALTVTPRGGLIGGTTSQNSNVDVIRGDWGLGLLNRNVPLGSDRSGLFRRIHVDGRNSAERIRLEFSRDTRIDELFFAFVGPFERFDLVVDGVDIDVVSELGTDEIYRLAPRGWAPGLVRLPSTLPFGRKWEFLARGLGDEWNIEALKATSVPGPSGGAALASLLLCAAFLARRRPS